MNAQPTTIDPEEINEFTELRKMFTAPLTTDEQERYKAFGAAVYDLCEAWEEHCMSTNCFNAFAHLLNDAMWVIKDEAKIKAVHIEILSSIEQPAVAGVK